MGIYAYALDDTDLEIEIVTGPEFGCVAFEPKDRTDVSGGQE